MSVTKCEHDWRFFGHTMSGKPQWRCSKCRAVKYSGMPYLDPETGEFKRLEKKEVRSE